MGTKIHRLTEVEAADLAVEMDRPAVVDLTDPEPVRYARWRVGRILRMTLSVWMAAGS